MSEWLFGFKNWRKFPQHWCRESWIRQCQLSAERVVFSSTSKDVKKVQVALFFLVDQIWKGMKLRESNSRSVFASFASRIFFLECFFFCSLLVEQEISLEKKKKKKKNTNRSDCPNPPQEIPTPVRRTLRVANDVKPDAKIGSIFWVPRWWRHCAKSGCFFSTWKIKTSKPWHFTMWWWLAQVLGSLYHYHGLWLYDPYITG